MSALVGSTPSFTRSGRPNDSFCRNSSSLMICAAPRFNNPSASSGCMSLRNTRRANALLIFVQQFAHVFDRHRLVLALELDRLLTLASIKEGALLRKLASVRRFVCVVRRAHQSRGRCRIRAKRRCRSCAKRGTVARGVERFRLEFVRRVTAISAKLFRLFLLLKIKRPRVGAFVDRGAIGDEFFLLRGILQRRVRFEQTIDQLLLLFLRRRAGCEQEQREKLLHDVDLAIVDLSGQARCAIWTRTAAASRSRAGSGKPSPVADNISCSHLSTCRRPRPPATRPRTNLCSGYKCKSQLSA